MQKQLRVGITHGDINGISYEIILKMLSDERVLDLFTPVIYGSSKVANFYRKALNLQSIPLNSIESAEDAQAGTNNIVEVLEDEPRIELGKVSKEAGVAAVAALEQATEDLKEGLIDVLVTAPICKASVQSEEFNFPGHTEYLHHTLGKEEEKPLMILCNEATRVALVTIHIPISQIAQQITKDNVLEKLILFQKSLRRDFGIDAPRIAVLGLNPHAGDGGLLGTEEIEEISPAIKEAQDLGILAFGPYAADGFWGAQNNLYFDGVLAMYHDQGLAPFKTLAMEGGVNFTAGLEYVRTSPDHGVGFDIAGKGEASEESLRQAIYCAIDVFRNRHNYDQCRQNPLQRQQPERQERKASKVTSSIKSTPAPTEHYYNNDFYIE